MVGNSDIPVIPSLEIAKLGTLKLFLLRIGIRLGYFKATVTTSDENYIHIG